MEKVVDPTKVESQIYTTFKVIGGKGILKNMTLNSSEKTKITIYCSLKNTPDGTYSTAVNLKIDGTKVNSYTKIINVSSFAYIGNRRSLEIHKRECPWVAEMSSYNKIPLDNLEEARKRGFDNCAICMGNSLR
jgi:hypothetical protein